MKQDHYSWFIALRYLVLCLGIPLVAAESHLVAQEERTPDEEWTVVSQIGESDENPVKVTMQDLWGRPGYYHERLVLVRGTLNVLSPATGKRREGPFELREGRHAVPLLVDTTVAPESAKALTSFDGVAVEVLGRFVNMAPAGDRGEILNDIDSIFVGSLRRLDESGAEADTAAKGGLAASSDRSGKPPQIISSNPKPGETGVPLATRIILRFSEEMDETSFAGNVQLRYAGESDTDGSFPNLRLSYNPDTASLVIDPGQNFERRSEVHLFLQKGILSKEGVPMLRNLPSSRRKVGIRSRRSVPAITENEDVVVVLIFYTL